MFTSAFLATLPNLAATALRHLVAISLGEIQAVALDAQLNCSTIGFGNNSMDAESRRAILKWRDVKRGGFLSASAHERSCEAARWRALLPNCLQVWA
jgi:hypothetical protein